MQIKKIHIQGFKSLKNFVFEPETGFSCLVGSNGAGKSNFCDALLFLKKLVLFGLPEAFDSFGGASIIGNCGNINSSLSFEIVLSEGNLLAKYFLSINVENQTVTSESIKTSSSALYERNLNEGKIINLLEVERVINLFSDIEENKETLEQLLKKKKKKASDFKYIKEQFSKVEELLAFKTKVDKGDILDYQSKSLSEEKTGLGTFFTDSILYLFFKELNIYRLNPLVPKMPNRVFNKSNLLIYGENLAMILAELKKDEEKWQVLCDWLNLIVPSILDIEVKQGEFDDSLSLHFKEDDQLLPAICISDGTIYTLSILAAILWNQNKDTLVVIEEPERGIHPQAITELINFMREATQQNLNIITTTHSETFVRNCKLEELWLVDKIAGHTQIKSAKQQNPHLKEASLDQAWLMNLFNGGLPW